MKKLISIILFFFITVSVFADNKDDWITKKEPYSGSWDFSVHKTQNNFSDSWDFPISKKINTYLNNFDFIEEEKVKYFTYDGVVTCFPKNHVSEYSRRFKKVYEECREELRDLQKERKYYIRQYKNKCKHNKNQYTDFCIELKEKYDFYKNIFKK